MRRMVAAASLVVLLVGCSGGKATPGGTSGLSKEEFISKANTICGEFQTKLDALGEPQSQEQLQSWGESAKSIIRDELSRLRALEPPAADAATVEAIWDKVEEFLPAVDQLVAAARGADPAAVEAAGQKLDRITTEANDLSNDYGLSVCGEES